MTGSSRLTRSLPGPEVQDFFPDAIEVGELTTEEVVELEEWRAELREGPTLGDTYSLVVSRPAGGKYSARVAANQRWRQRNPDKVREYQRRWREKNKARLKEAHDAYRERNAEKVKEWQKKAQRRRRARLQAERNSRDLQNRRLQGESG